MLLNRRLGIGRLLSVPAPSSVTHAVTKNDFTFSASVLTAVGATVGSSGVTINGSPAEGPNGGIAMTEATLNANYIAINTTTIGVRTSYPSGVHIMFHWKRNGTTDTAMIGVGTANASIYAGVADITSGSTLTAQGIGVQTYYIGGISTLAGVNRQYLWHRMYSDQLDRCFGYQNFAVGVGGVSDIFPGRYSFSTPFSFEGELLGWVVFTDWSQAEAVEAWLLAQNSADAPNGDIVNYRVPDGVPKPAVWFSPRNVTLSGSDITSIANNLGFLGSAASPGSTGRAQIATPADWGSRSVFSLPTRNNHTYTFTAASCRTGISIATYGDGTTSAFVSFDSLYSGGGIGEITGDAGTAALFNNLPPSAILDGAIVGNMATVLPLDKKTIGDQNSGASSRSRLFTDDFTPDSREWYGEVGDIMFWTEQLTSAQITKVCDMLDAYYA